jgi:hypothetical protein
MGKPGRLWTQRNLPVTCKIKELTKMKKLLTALAITLTLLMAGNQYAIAQTAVMDTEGSVFKQTCRITVGDTATLLTALVETALSDYVDWGAVKAAQLSCETNDVRVAWTSTPTQGASGIGHIIYTATNPRWVSNDKIKKAKLVAKTNGQTGYCQVTLEY